MRRFLSLMLLLALPASAAAQGSLLTVRDIVDLTKAGLGEEALIALIEVNRPIFPVDVDTLKGLKVAGVPPSVIVAMIKSGREAPPPPAVPVPVEAPWVAEPQPEPLPPPPPVVVVEHHERVREVPVAVPVYVAVPTRRIVDHPRRPAPKPAEPVYWGWGGKLRPDAWKPTAADVQKDAKVPLLPQRK